MAKITEKNIADSFQQGVLVYQKSISKKEAVDYLSDTGMHKKSASMYITCVIALLSGTQYGSTVNENATEYFLKKIYADFGKDHLIHALDALKLHLEYQEGKNNLPGLWHLHDRYSKV